MIADRNLFQILDHDVRFRPQTTQHANRSLGFTRYGKPATGVDVARSQRLFNVLNRDVVFEQRGRVDQYLVLLAITTEHEDFRDAGGLEQAWTNDPVGDRTKFELLFCIAVEMCVVHFAVDLDRSCTCERQIVNRGIFRLRRVGRVIGTRR